MPVVPTGFPGPTVPAGSGELLVEELVDTAAPPQAAKASIRMLPSESKVVLLKPNLEQRAADLDLDGTGGDTMGAIRRAGENHRKIGAIC